MKKDNTVQSAASAEAQLRVAKSVVGVAEREVESARAKAKQAKAKLKIAKKGSKLARKAAKSAKAKLRAARKSLKKLQAAMVEPLRKKAVAAKPAPVKLQVDQSAKKATAKTGRNPSRRRKAAPKIRARQTKPADEEVAPSSPVSVGAIPAEQAPQIETADSSTGATAAPSPEPPTS